MDELKNTDELVEEEALEQPKEPQAQEPEPYVERPRGQRILAWVLLVIVVIGVILWYYWIAKG